MAKRLAIFPTILQSAVACFVLLAPLVSFAQHAEAPESKVRPGADDAQSWERSLSLADEFLVQLAMANGLDPRRAELLRDLYQERRGARRRNIGEAEAGLITRRELRAASAKSESRLADRIRALLTAEEVLALDPDEATFQAVSSLQRIDTSAPGSANTAGTCAIEQAVYSLAESGAAEEWRLKFVTEVDGGKTTARVSGPFENSPFELDAILVDSKGGTTYHLGEAQAIFFDERFVSVSPRRRAPLYVFVYGLSSELAVDPVLRRNASLGDP